MTARVGNAAAVLAAAWSLPHKCCQALRAPYASSAISGAGYQYRSYVGTAAQRASRTTASLSGGFVPGGAGRRRVVAAAESRHFSSNGGLVGNNSRLVVQQRRAAAGAVRMASGGGSDESQFFTDPDAPSELDGVGPPGPLVGGDQVRALWRCCCRLQSTYDGCGITATAVVPVVNPRSRPTFALAYIHVRNTHVYYREASCALIPSA